MISLCHTCFHSSVECTVDEVTGFPICVETCHPKRSKGDVEKYHKAIRRLPARVDIDVDMMTQTMKGKSEL